MPRRRVPWRSSACIRVRPHACCTHDGAWLRAAENLSLLGLAKLKEESEYFQMDSLQRAVDEEAEQRSLARQAMEALRRIPTPPPCRWDRSS